MKRFTASVSKKTAAWLLAVLLCLLVPLEVFAAEGEAPLPSNVDGFTSQPSEASEEEPVPTQSPSPVFSEEEGQTVSEDSETDESELESPEESEEGGTETVPTEQQALLAGSLLVTGGHNTYLSGYAGGLFKPEADMTRAEVAQMLYNLLAAKQPVSSSQFSDVNIGKWYGVPVNTLAKAGVLKGYKDGTFAPDHTITRAEFVTAMTNCFSLSTGEVSFTDVTDSHWAYEYIASAVAKGWLDGYSDGSFRPDHNIKRCEAVKIVNEALGRKDDGFAADRNEQKFSDVPKTHWAFLEIAEAAKPVDALPSPSPSTDPANFKVGQSVQVTANGGLNLREQPNTSSKILTVLSTGAILTVTDVSQGSWLQVKTSTGMVGYVSSDYVTGYTPGQASGASLSAGSLSLHQYQSARLDASVSSGLSAMSWSSSDSSVAVVAYTLQYGKTEQGAVVYGKKPGKATLTFSDSAGKTKASCTVTVSASEAVRSAYADKNIVPFGSSFNLVAVTDTSRSAVKFEIASGPAKGAYETTQYEVKTQNSSHGLGSNSVRIFKKPVTFGTAGTYTIRAYSKNSSGYSSDYYQFTVMVSSSAASSASETAFAARRASTEIIKLLANFEGIYHEVDEDQLAVKNPTVGHGYVVPVNSAFYNTITSEEAFAVLVNTVNQKDYSSAVERFRSKYNIKMSQAQFDALVSFAYNLGPGYFSPNYGFCQAILNATAPPSASEAAPATGTVNVNGSETSGDPCAWIFEKTSVTSAKIQKVPVNHTVSIVGSQVLKEKQQVWYKVKYSGKTGWMPAGYVNISGASHDLTYADSTVVANNLLQWNKADGVLYKGLVWRRMAECKIFFFANYAEAYHTNANYDRNTYYFNFPEECKQYDLH